MIASKDWGPCACGCEEYVRKGDEFRMIAGCMYLQGHEARATRMIPAIGGKLDKSRNASNKEESA